MLSPASWQHKYQGSGYGKLRTDHDCGPGRTLTISRDERGLHAHCFRCNDSGWLPPEPVPLAVRLERLSKSREADNAIGAQVELPEPQVRVWADWPAMYRLWFLKAGLSAADLPRLGAYYHPSSDRVVLPVSDPLLGLLFWQARAEGGRQPKYIAPPVDKHRVLAAYGRANEVTLVEDILSAYKVGKVGEGWSMLGTSLSDHLASTIVSRGCKVNVWLDPDKAGQVGAHKVLAKLRAYGVECRNIISKVDPKKVFVSDIKELLCLK